MALKYVVNTKEYDGYATAILYDGICPFTGLTEEDYIKLGYTLMNDTAFFAFDASFETSLCGKWNEISKGQYEEALKKLTPVQLSGEGFYIDKCIRGSLFPFYQKMGDKYYTSLQSIRTPRENILADLKSYMESTTATSYFSNSKEDINANA